MEGRLHRRGFSTKHATAEAHAVASRNKTIVWLRDKHDNEPAVFHALMELVLRGRGGESRRQQAVEKAIEMEQRRRSQVASDAWHEKRCARLEAVLREAVVRPLRTGGELVVAASEERLASSAMVIVKEGVAALNARLIALGPLAPAGLAPLVLSKNSKNKSNGALLEEYRLAYSLIAPVLAEHPITVASAVAAVHARPAAAAAGAALTATARLRAAKAAQLDAEDAVYCLERAEEAEAAALSERRLIEAEAVAKKAEKAAGRAADKAEKEAAKAAAKAAATAAAKAAKEEKAAEKAEKKRVREAKAAAKAAAREVEAAEAAEEVAKPKAAKSKAGKAAAAVKAPEPLGVVGRLEVPRRSTAPSYVVLWSDGAHTHMSLLEARPLPTMRE